MLERQPYLADRPAFQARDEDSGASLSPSYFLEIAKRRALFFIIPFVLVGVVGSLITIAWPSRYLAEGTILVSSQEIPSDLVRPTVAALANDRIQVIQQRIMTRNNLLGVAKKFDIKPFWQAQPSGTDIVDFIRSRTEITAVSDRLLASAGTRKNAIAFKVGFEYEKPQVAMGVANELVTMILNEDVRSRTEFATQTTRFLEQEVNRLETKLGSINKQIGEFRQLNLDAVATTPKANEDVASLAALKAELVVKGSTLSDQHPDIKALKRKIAGVEKAAAAKTVVSEATAAASTNAPITEKKNDVGIDTLETQRFSVREELTKAIQKVSAARLGENMERSQQSERLEVIEQPTMPQNSIKPNKPKLFALVAALAVLAGGGLAFAAEMLDKSIRRRTDLFPIVDSNLVFAIPYIITPDEVMRRKRKILLMSVLVALVLIVGVAAIVFILPPVDVLIDKLVARIPH